MSRKPRPTYRTPERQEWLAKDYSLGKVADYKPYNFVDGEGVRCSVYFSGCLFACRGCYNAAVQNFHYGYDYTPQLQEEILEDVSASYCQGLTLLGGEPFLNTNTALPLAKATRERFGSQKDIWVWSGYTFEELLSESDDKLELLHLCDVLVDGRFVQDLMDLTLTFRGSSNQRIIDVPKSLAAGEVVLWNEGKYLEEERSSTSLLSYSDTDSLDQPNLIEMDLIRRSDFE